MGVSGCGKTSVGQALAKRCGVNFIDGDALHPQSNIDKMASGTPLTDADRAPWLEAVGNALGQSTGTTVIGCSALKRIYRDTIRTQAGEPVHFLHLDAPQAILQCRVDGRAGHFMPPALLQSQFDALEALAPDEAGTRIDISRPLPHVIEHAVRILQKKMT